MLIDASPRRGASDLGPAPAELRCRAEVTLHNRAGHDVGRVDLVFDDGDVGEFCLLVELKLHSQYGIAQLPRYLDGLAAVEASRKALIAVTKTAPLAGESYASKNDLWLGSLRWSVLYDQLAALAPSAPALGAAWRAILRLLREQGDLGPMDLDLSLIDAWAKRDAAERQIMELLTDLARPTEEALRAAFGRGLEDKTAAELLFKGKGRTQPVFSFKNRMMISFAVPSGAGEERFRVQFFARRGQARFTVEARYQHRHEDLRGDDAVMAATEALKTSGVRYGRDNSGHNWASSRPARDVLADPDPLSRMIAEIASVANTCARAQLFGALAARRPNTVATSVGDPESDE